MVIFSIIGLGYFAYGKKSRQLLMLICGIALMVYSYFVNGIVYIVLIGVGLTALPFILGRK
jgi:predicted phage tail protein